MTCSTGAVPVGRGGLDSSRTHEELGSGAGTAFHLAQPGRDLQVIPDWPLVSVLGLGSLPTAVGCARDHARLVLAEWGFGHLVEDAVLLVSELVTNALKASWSLQGHPPIALRLLANDRQLLVEAWDQLVGVTALQPLPPSDGDHGRGLAVVAALSNRWGVGRMGSKFKVVWCELAVEPS